MLLLSSFVIKERKRTEFCAKESHASVDQIFLSGGKRDDSHRLRNDFLSRKFRNLGVMAFKELVIPLLSGRARI